MSQPVELARIDALMPPADQRAELFQQAIAMIEGYYRRLDQLPVMPEVHAEEIREYLAVFQFADSLDPQVLLRQVGERLESWNLHVPHPRYFGLFNPAPGFYGVLAARRSSILHRFCENQPSTTIRAQMIVSVPRDLNVR